MATQALVLCQDPRGQDIAQQTKGGLPCNDGNSQDNEDWHFIPVGRYEPPRGQGRKRSEHKNVPSSPATETDGLKDDALGGAVDLGREADAAADGVFEIATMEHYREGWRPWTRSSTNKT